ncbi:MAG: branched-chain amino acid transport system II carrier protein [Verrucomicrobiota bacterium]|nr:branched-chain amino acid transport system II carrier protein [Verrucomicrobiota bacterium]
MSSRVVAQAPARRAPGILITGVALFSMFFGAGNLIFPLLIGQKAGSGILPALFGLSISAILFPILGLMTMRLFNGNIKSFLEGLGKGPSFFLLSVLQIIQGPICLARLIQLMYASLKPYFPAPFPFFVLCMLALFYLIAYRSHRLIPWLSKVLTPFFILSLVILIVAGLFSAPPLPVSAESAFFHFSQGLKGGYMTMDLISALLFATVVIPQFMAGGISVQESKRRMFGASCVAAFLLLLAYLGLTLVAAHHGQTLSTRPEELLQGLAQKILGAEGAFLSAVIVFFACLTTAVALATVFANYIHQEISAKKIPFPPALVITLLLAAGVASVDFGVILHWMGIVLDLLYPALTLLCLCHFIRIRYPAVSLKIPVFAALLFGSVRFYLQTSL